MDVFYADLHIHSRFSRATSKRLSVRNLAAWGAVKGIKVLATGDFTHPEWFQELEDQLQQEDGGLFSLKEPTGLDEEIPWLKGCSPPLKTKFMLCTELSSIYKRGGSVRKIHNLVYLPTFDAAKQLNSRLAQIGNIASDGRPILGLDARDLLEMVLELDPQAFVIPAHVWTPWFSLFGSKSGFDSLEECFGSLAGEIFALETGLSSDPEMNWLWSKLDRFSLVSNSDAHSGDKLAREANIFSGEPSYETILRALKGVGLGHKFLGTLEFFPEEGKYHLDGHRKCGVVLDPRESRQLGNICPVCGQPLTLGVLHRVLSLADRSQPQQPSAKPGFTPLIPLQEILGEILGVGPKTKTVTSTYAKLITELGSELFILQHAPLEDIGRFSTLLAEGIKRMRNRDVFRQPGFDGQYGVISVFTPRERQEFTRGRSLIDRSSEPDTAPRKNLASRFKDWARSREEPQAERRTFNAKQKDAVAAGPEPVLVLAGPGTGKTRTLMGRIAHLLETGSRPEGLLAVTFTRAAARELQERLQAMLGQEDRLPVSDTLHALAYANWLDVHRHTPVLLSDEEAKKVFEQANAGLGPHELDSAWRSLNLAREGRRLDDSLEEWAREYFQLKDHWNLADYTDLLESWLEQLEQSREPSGLYDHVLVDEVQDMSRLQLELIRRLTQPQGKGFFAIGDPDQSIYSFRGAAQQVRETLEGFWPALKVISLERNYRSRQNLLDFASMVFPNRTPLKAALAGQADIAYYRGETADQEAFWIAESAKKLLGGTAHTQADQETAGELAPGDIAVLARFKALLPPIERSLNRLGLPYSVPEDLPFWQEPRIALIIRTAAEFLGIGPDGAGETLDCPDRILAEGPQGLAAYFQDMPPFDHLFWKSQPFQELKKAYAEHRGWSGLISWINLESDLSRVREKAQKIRLLTMHAAKGLEFEAVFLPAVEQGIVPFAGKELLSGKPQQADERPDPQEEKRLFYVAMTRAKSRLFLSTAAKRSIYGRQHLLQPSPFLSLLDWNGVQKFKNVSKTIRQEKQLSLL